MKVQNSDSSQVDTETSQVGVSTPNVEAQSVSIRTGEKLASWSEAEARAFFSEVFCGEHHIPNRGKLRPCGRGWSVGGVYSPATWDGNLLTRLVFLAHDHCVRVDISPSQPGRLRIDAWKRVPIGATDSPIMMGHPTLEQAVALHHGKPWREIVAEAKAAREPAKPNNTLSIDEIATLGRNFLNHVNGKAG